MKFKDLLNEVKTIVDYEKLPDFEPLPILKKLEKKYGKARWKQFNNNKESSKTIKSSDLIIISPKDKKNLKTQLHEYGHYIHEQGIISMAGLRRLYNYYKKHFKGTSKDWLNIDDNDVFVGRGHQGIAEFFADMFMYNMLGKLKGDNKTVIDMLLTGKKF